MRPSLDIISTHSGHFPLCFVNGTLFSRFDRKIYRWKSLGEPRRKERVDSLPASIASRVLSSARPLERLFRKGLSHFALTPNESKLAILDKRILWKSREQSSWKEIGNLSRLSRPMRFGMCSTSDNRFLIGEYSSNRLREKVALWQVAESGRMEIAYSFPDHTIRHIHAVQEDPFSGEIWLTTGDYGPECKVLVSGDGCHTFEQIGKGDQSWRTCCVVFAKDAVLWGMDSPVQRSFVIRWDRASREREFVAELSGPIWHGTSNRSGWYTFSTAVEPSAVYKRPLAGLWTSPNGRDFYEVAAFTKDQWPWVYFQFGLIYFPIGVAPSDYVVFSGNALKEYDNTMVIGRLIP